MRWYDLVTIIAAIIIVGCIIVILQFYYNGQKDECLRDPLSFGARQIEEAYGYEFYGTGLVVVPNGSSFSISFNSNGTTFD